MSWFDLPREPEPEAMDDSGEVEAYSSAAAQKYLSAIDDTFVRHAVRLVSGRGSGVALDIGTGPGQMVVKMARRLPGWRWVGVDRSANMIRKAVSDLAEAGESPSRGALSISSGLNVLFLAADANRLPFADASFDLVTCNSVLHHLHKPKQLFAEIARIARPGAAILLRDLRRPNRLAYPMHIRWFGRKYSGLMYKLYCDSVRSAYMPGELAELLQGSSLEGLRVFTRGRTHLGLERPAR